MNSENKFEAGDFITIGSCPVLGNDPIPARVVSVEPYGYMVDDSGWIGPVGFDLLPLQEVPDPKGP